MSPGSPASGYRTQYLGDRCLYCLISLVGDLVIAAIIWVGLVKPLSRDRSFNSCACSMKLRSHSLFGSKL